MARYEEQLMTGQQQPTVELGGCGTPPRGGDFVHSKVRVAQDVSTAPAFQHDPT